MVAVPPIARRAGVYFEPVRQRTLTPLPRMDVATFVGFAASGPVNVPVVVEDIHRFRDVFGDDTPLAWNPQQNEVQYSLLGPAVEAFFQNGGRRCWVIRVADSQASAFVTLQFPLEGLVAVSSNDASQAMVAARSRGQWASVYKVGTVLHARQLAPVGNLDQALSLEVDSFSSTPYVVLTVSSIPADFPVGELVVVEVGDARLYMLVEKIHSNEQGVQLISEQAYACLPLSSPPAGLQGLEWDNWICYALAQLDQTSFEQQFALHSPAASPQIYRLRFEMEVWHHSHRIATIKDLGFHSLHPRYWQRLPSDEQLFEPSPGDLNPIQSQAFLDFIQETAQPRFPLAGINSSEKNVHYLPLGMANSSGSETAFGPSNDYTGDNVLEAEGLAVFSSRLFLDSGLADIRVEALTQELNQRVHLDHEKVHGIYNTVLSDETTFVAVPDAVHRPWDRNIRQTTTILPAPELVRISKPDSLGFFELQWTKVADITDYEIQKSLSPDFTDVEREIVSRRLSRARSTPAPNRLLLQREDKCAPDWYFRVRAMRYGEPSPWSNTRVLLRQDHDFDSCNRLPAHTLELRLRKALSSPQAQYELSWEPWDPTQNNIALVDKFQIQQSASASFSSSVLIELEYGSPPYFELLVEQDDTVQFFRVRGVCRDTFGPWSNTVWVLPGFLSLPSLVPDEEYAASAVLLPLQRALMRLCAALGDCLAVLTLPVHYREMHVLEHVTALKSPGAASGGDVHVPELSQGERRVLSHGAVFYPWVSIAGAGNDQQGNRWVPADGGTCGIMAKNAHTKGAWRASANQVYQFTIALTPRLTVTQESQLAAAQVNVVTQTTEGFSCLSESTLSIEQEFIPIHVRLLLILLRRFMLREGNNYVFEPNDRGFQSRVQHQFERAMSSLYQRGAFAGASPAQAYTVVTDESVNTVHSLEAGRFIVELRVRPAQAIHFITVRLLQANRAQVAVQEA